MYRHVIVIKTYTSKLVRTMRFWNNLHQVLSKSKYYVVPVFCVIVTFLSRDYVMLYLISVLTSTFLSRDYVMLYLISVLTFTFWLCCVTNIFTYDFITTADIIYWQYIVVVREAGIYIEIPHACRKSLLDSFHI
jgi:hypothetical protein